MFQIAEFYKCLRSCTQKTISLEHQISNKKADPESRLYTSSDENGRFPGARLPCNYLDS
jgi:hypothetical protein